MSRRAVFLVLVAISAAILPAPSRAGGSVVENGGHFVHCANAVDSSVFRSRRASLDVFEGSERLGLHYRALASYRGETLERAYPKAIARFFARSPGLRQRLLALFASFRKSARFVPEASLSWRNQHSPVATERGCRVGRAIIQVVPSVGKFEGRVLLRIAREAWSELATDHKIALLVHEYLQATMHVIAPSCNVGRIRESVGRFLSDEALAMSLGDWSALRASSCEDRDSSFGG